MQPNNFYLDKNKLKNVFICYVPTPGIQQRFFHLFSTMVLASGEDHIFKAARLISPNIDYMLPTSHFSTRYFHTHQNTFTSPRIATSAS